MFLGFFFVCVWGGGGACLVQHFWTGRLLILAKSLLSSTYTSSWSLNSGSIAVCQASSFGLLILSP